MPISLVPNFLHLLANKQCTSPLLALLCSLVLGLSGTTSTVFCAELADVTKMPPECHLKSAYLSLVVSKGLWVAATPLAPTFHHESPLRPASATIRNKDSLLILMFFSTLESERGWGGRLPSPRALFFPPLPSAVLVNRPPAHAGNPVVSGRLLSPGPKVYITVRKEGGEAPSQREKGEPLGFYLSVSRFKGCWEIRLLFYFPSWRVVQSKAK